jgi:hypothetical protein
MRTSASLCLVTLTLGLAVPLFAVPIAIGSAETNMPGISIDLVSLERKGAVLTVKWAIRNGNTDAATGKTQVKFGYMGPRSSTYLVDEESGTKYYVLTDKEGRSVASQHEYLGADVYGINEYVEAGGTRRYWAKFPAPPPEVKVLTVLFDATEPFESAPITEK